MRKVLMAGMLLLALGACGKKEPPQPDTSQPLRMVGLSSQVVVSVLQLKFTIAGGYGNVGYQIDRAEEDKVCGCLTPWQRYLDQPPLPNQKGKEIIRNIKLLSYDRAFAYRIRAVDSTGTLTQWSETIHARAIKPK